VTIYAFAAAGRYQACILDRAVQSRSHVMSMCMPIGKAMRIRT
jgi:hypothetical protein